MFLHYYVITLILFENGHIVTILSFITMTSGTTYSPTKFVIVTEPAINDEL